jgi:hypothetical protein
MIGGRAPVTTGVPLGMRRPLLATREMILETRRELLPTREVFFVT